MNYERNFWVVGGDMRQAKLAQLLADDGHTVHIYALEQAAEAAPDAIVQSAPDGLVRADCLILPLPVTTSPDRLSTPLSRGSHTLSMLLDYLSPSQIICGGRVDGGTREQLLRRGLIIHDYFAREELAVANAVPTAEGAVQIAMEELPVTIHGARVLVIGFGRVGRITAHRFAALGARVTVAARRYEQMAWARAYGYDAEHPDRLHEWLCGCDLVINTVPALILGEAQLQEIRRDCLIIDLASLPGGVDLTAARQLGRRVIQALSLPGRVAPVTAGKSIRDTIYNIIQELERSSP